MTHNRGLVITREQLRRLLDAPGRARDRVQTYLLVFTAARMSEIQHLRWRDVDFDRREIGSRGKFGKTNVIPMHEQLYAALRRWQVEQRRESEQHPQLAAALADPERAYVLLTDAGKKLAHSTISKQLKWRAARVGLLAHADASSVGDENKSRISPHVLRRTFATLALNDGTPLEAIAEMLNHASIDTTRKHYAFTSSEKKRQTVAAFNV